MLTGRWSYVSSNYRVWKSSWSPCKTHGLDSTVPYCVPNMGESNPIASCSQYGFLSCDGNSEQKWNKNQRSFQPTFHQWWWSRILTFLFLARLRWSQRWSDTTWESSPSPTSLWVSSSSISRIMGLLKLFAMNWISGFVLKLRNISMLIKFRSPGEAW